MHQPRLHQSDPLASPGNGDRIWLIAGTGEGPPLAEALLAQGWRLRVSVVSRAAALAYRGHPCLELAVGAIGGPGSVGSGAAPVAGVAAELERSRLEGLPYRWVIDASHPFATRISAELAIACRAQVQRLLRLRRPELPLGPAIPLSDLACLAQQCLPGERLLAAIGARRLAEVVTACPEAVHHARLLPQGEAIGMALAAGLMPQRLAPLRPSSDGRIERALCRHWGIETVLCRRSGGANEAHWHRICAELGLRLLLLERPREPEGVEGLALPALLERLGQSGGSARSWVPCHRMKHPPPT
jgi:precorrin-6A/cobalt-precorrin-6A reductase